MKTNFTVFTSVVAALALNLNAEVRAADAAPIIEAAGWKKIKDLKIQTDAEPLNGTSYQKRVANPEGGQVLVTLIYQKDRELAWVGLNTDQIAFTAEKLVGFSWIGNGRLLFSSETRKLGGEIQAITTSLTALETDVATKFATIVKERSFKQAFDLGGFADKTRAFRIAGLQVVGSEFTLSLEDVSKERVPATITLDKDLNYVSSSLDSKAVSKEKVTSSEIRSTKEAQELRSKGESLR